LQSLEICLKAILLLFEVSYLFTCRLSLPLQRARSVSGWEMMGGGGVNNTALPLVTFSKVASGIASLGRSVVDETVAELHFISLIHILDTLWKLYN